MREVPTFSYIIAPIKVGERVAGTLTVGRTTDGLPFSMEDLGVIEEMALRTALMLHISEEHQRALDEVDRRTHIQAALQESEKRYRTVAELRPLALLVNHNGLIGYANVAAAELLGVAQVEQLLGVSPLEFIHPDFHKIAHERASHALQDNGVNPPLEQTWVRPDGSSFDCEVSSASIPWEGTRAILLCCRDITERKEAEASMKEAAQIKDEFLSLVSHELRTPLTTILGYASLLARKPDMPEEIIRDSARDLLSEAERLNSIVENMLVLGRSQVGHVLPQEPVAVRMVIAETLEKFQARNATATVSCAAIPDCSILGVAEYLRQVIENLLSNALKYSPDGAPIEVSCELEGDRLWVHVADRGRGIADPDTVFGAFVRENGAAGMASGIGLGLTVCKRLVEAMDGTIKVSSREGGGSIFSFSTHKLEAAE